MRIGFFVNDVATEEAGYTTTRLAMAANNRGHEVWVMGAADLAMDPDDRVRAHARAAPERKYKKSDLFLKALVDPKGRRERVALEDLDILLLRNDPSADATHRAWAQSVGINFGRVAMRHGVIVLNDPNGLAKAVNKMYLQGFPEEVRPKTLITRNRDDLRAFVNDRGKAVLKPLQGSGGQNVFLVSSEEVSNLNQIIDAISRDGYVIAQEYLPQAEAGDTRLFLMNGLPLRHKGKYAAFRRVRTGGDLRSNIHAGGKLARAELDDAAFHIADMVRPKLVEDGMFLVGLDVVGDKLMEINVFSPGGLGSAQKFEKVNFAHAVIAALERKTAYQEYYRRGFANAELASL